MSFNQIVPAAVEPLAKFMTLLGYCITDWARIEEELFLIMRNTLDISQERAAIIYLRTPTLETRMNLVDELVVTAFPQPERKNGGHRHKDLDIWDTLLKDIKAELPMRNQLAHSPVGAGIYAFVDDAGQVESEGLKIRVESYPHMHERARAKSADKKPLGIEELTDYRPKIIALHERLRAFHSGPLAAQLSKPR